MSPALGFCSLFMGPSNNVRNNRINLLRMKSMFDCGYCDHGDGSISALLVNRKPTHGLYCEKA